MTMNNTKKNAIEFYLNSLPDGRYKNYLLESIGEYEETAKVKMTLTELCELMVNYTKEVFYASM